ncbi:hypothetical protein RUR49_18380 [Pseudoxanthobacter sp. M-2]|uniref:hypothetical protein n=1 Tax=Pseudoxanthobacter sp. M-2 TaxID=3078754 RepID=UPI0038FBEFB2
MTRRSWPAIGAAALLSATALPFLSLPVAAAEGRDIVEGWKAWAAGLNVEGLDFEIAAVEEAEGGAVTVMKGLELTWTGVITMPSSDANTPAERLTYALEASIPEMRFTDLRRTSEGFAAASFAAPVMTLAASGEVGGEGLGFREVLHDYTSTEPRWAAWPDIPADPDRPFSRFEPLWRMGVQWSASADRVERTEVEIIQPDGGQTMTMGPMEVSGTSGGTFERVLIGPSEGTMIMEVANFTPGPDGTLPPPTRQEMTVRQGPQELLGYAYAPFYDAIFRGGPGLGKPPVSMLASAKVGAVEVSGADLGYTIGAQSIEDVRVGVPEVNVAREIDRLILAAQAGSVDPADVADLALTVYQGFAVGRLSAEGFSFDMPELAMSFGEMVLERLSKDGMGLFSIGKIEARGEDGPNNLGTFALGRFAIRDVVFPTKEAIMALARLGSDPLGGGQPIEPSTRQILDVVPMIGGVELEGLAVDSDMTGPVALDRFALTLGGFVPPVPTETAIELSGLSFPTALVTDPDAKAFLEQAGIEQVNIDGRYVTTWTEGANTFDLDPFALTVEGLGSAEVTMALSGVPRTVFEAPDKAQLAMPEVMVDGVTARFSNAPKLAGPLADFAKEQQISPETAIGVIGDVIRNELAPMSGDGFADSLGSAVKQFLTGPTGSLELVARPAQPVPLVQVVGAATLAPGSLVKLLNAVVEYRQ